MRILPALVLAVMLGSCTPPEEAAAPTTPPIDPAIAEAHRASEVAEQQNLLNMGHGAAVVSRTAELTFENSAIRAIDGDPDSLWASPPLDFDQTLVFSLPAPVRVEQIGIRTPPSAVSRIEALTIDWSGDGETFTNLALPPLQQSLKPQMFNVDAENVRFLRLHVTDGGAQLAALQSVLVHGRWMAPPTVEPLAGCFSINEASGFFEERGGRVTGSVGDGDDRQFVDGGVDDATYRFAWTRGPEWGYAIVTLTPDGQILNGLTWHEEAAAHSFGTSWYGSRRSCGSTPRIDADAVVRTFLRRSGWYPLFSLHFDESNSLIENTSRGALDIIRMVQQRARAHRIRIVAREYGELSPDAARQRVIARLHSLANALARHGVDVSQIDFVAAGSDSPRRPVDIEVMRRFYGVTEIVLPETARSAF